MTIKIEEVTTHKQLNTFIKFPFSIYKGNPYWTPPLLMDEKNTLDWKKNPAFEVAQARYWLAYKDGTMCVLVGWTLSTIVKYPEHSLKRWKIGRVNWGCRLCMALWVSPTWTRKAC